MQLLDRPTAVRDATTREAFSALGTASIRRGLILLFNQRSVAGFITLPGVMTGQLIAGLDLIEADRPEPFCLVRRLIRMKVLLVSSLRRLRERSLLAPLLGALAVFGVALGFALLGSEVREGETHAFDMALLQHAVALRASHAGLTEVIRDLTALGSTLLMTMLALITCGYLWLVRWRLHACLVGASIGSAALLVGALKTLFGRSRPDASFAAFVQAGLSFPSGHASMSAVVYLTLGVLLASTRERLAERVYILATAACITVLVGLSRVALGVHWATDVLGGWAFGTAWAAAWLLLASALVRWLARRQAATGR